MPIMNAHHIWTGLTLPLAVLMAAAAVAGVIVDTVYARETASWATQGKAQDLATLVIAVPILLASGHRAHRGDARAWLVWLGTLLYTLYSYVLYAFFVHFGTLFPVYVAILGLSFYAIVGSLATTDLAAIARAAAGVRTGSTSVFLMISGTLFSVLWLGDILGSLRAGRDPASLVETGLIVNPVHVLDLALLCPAMIITGVLLRKRHVFGLVFAVPLLVFAAIMGIAILAMMVAQGLAGLPAAIGPAVMMAVIVATSAYLAARFLAGLRADPAATPRVPR